ncbi:BF3164 family lipoprotein [Parabacteroides provencensis]|uniref:BF3164 family lipoprotein n=1 Tax=Parabacteroides provencensis TaxID=1944636 RepID=UPI000C16212A|nr:BF3164 family lipoprotein [Parabacteroides provencensis]
MKKTKIKHISGISLLFISVFISGCTHVPNETIKNNSFSGEIINMENQPVIQSPVLKGYHIRFREGYIKPAGRIFVKGDTCIVENAVTQNEPYFLAYSLSEKKRIGKFGIIGNGPNEMLYPDFSGFRNCPGFIGEVYDSGICRHFLIDKDFNIHLDSIWTNIGETMKLVSSGNMSYMAKNETNGNSLYCYHAGDTTKTRIYNLALDPQVHVWSAYIGSLEINPVRKILVYAYQYFRQIHIFNLETNTCTIIKYPDQHKKHNDIKDWLDITSVSYYLDVSLGEQYIYCLYSGKTPKEVIEDDKKDNKFCFSIEQYDYDGNYIRTIQINKRTRYLSVDESRNKLYVLSVFDDEPLYVYDLPPVNTHRK